VAGILSARQKVMPRWAKSRHTPARCRYTSCAVVVEKVLPGRYPISLRIHSTIACTRPMPGGWPPNNWPAVWHITSDSQ
jgi:hypothetical protein